MAIRLGAALCVAALLWPIGANSDDALPVVKSVTVPAAPGPAVTLPPVSANAPVHSATAVHAFLNKFTVSGKTLKAYDFNVSGAYSAFKATVESDKLSAGARYRSASLQQAVVNFRLSKQLIDRGVNRKPGSPPPPVAIRNVHAGQGVWISGIQSPTAFYANHTIYPNVQLLSLDDFLYAPTGMAPTGCIEVVTKYGYNAPPQVWAYDWCNNLNQEPGKALDVNADFINKFVRRMPNGLTQYTAETILLADGKTWVAQIFDYGAKKWFPLLYSAGKRSSDLDQFTSSHSGWDMFEVYSDLNGPGGVADICATLPGPIAASGISISYDGGSQKAFKLVGGTNSSGLTFDQFHCPHLYFSSGNSYDWSMIYR
jgi:hypothetical protein